jgi:DNA-binding LytR/AlgR family response regulator
MKTNPFIRIGAWQEASPNELLMLEAEINYTVLHFINGKKLMVATTMKNLESRLKPYNFFRTHRSYLVNMDCIKQFRECDGCLELNDSQVIEVSRRKLVEFKRKYSMQIL